VIVKDYVVSRYRIMMYLTFIRPCIVIYFYSKTNEMELQFLLVPASKQLAEAV